MNYFDLHCDTISECAEQQVSLLKNQLHISLERGMQYDRWIQCFAAWIPDTLRGQDAIAYYERVYQTLLHEIEQNSDKIMLCKTQKDFEIAQHEKKCAAIFTVEGGAAAGGKLESFERMAQCGVKAMTLTWNDTCELGDGAMVQHPKGLTEFGRAAVQEMERLHIAVDVSHASEPLFYDVAANTQRPFLATHSNARALCNHKRNLTDEQFIVIRERGGIVGVNFVPCFLNTQEEKASLEDVLRHIEHFLSLGGEKTVAIGSDFDGISTPLPHGIRGVESVASLAEEMLRRNYPETLVQAVLFENAYRFFISL